MSRHVALTPRDHELVRCVWALGWVTSDVLREVVAPATQVKTLTRRLGQLVDAGYLRRRRIVGGVGHLWLYGTGRLAPVLDPAFRDAWRPSDAQVLHTLAVGETLATLVAPGRLGGLVVTSWQGEAALRTWHRAGQPVADLYVEWTIPSGRGAWHVEVDRGTEARNAWRRKLVRYLHVRSAVPLVVTTSDTRARNLALLARELGVAALTTDAAALRGEAVPQVYDALKGCRRSVDNATS